MHDFLSHNRDELIERCKQKVSRRARRLATPEQLRNGIPLFLDQLTLTLEEERYGRDDASLRISGASGGDALEISEIGVGAVAHGKMLLGLGYTVDQVVHDYGDLCQAITELAIERDAPFSVREFRTLNRCLDNAIADAVTAFSLQRESLIADRLASQADERLGLLVHELRNSLTVASLSVRAMERGGLTLVGATGSVLKRSLGSMRNLVDNSIARLQTDNATGAPITLFSVAALIEEAKTSAELEADARHCRLVVAPVNAALHVEADREALLRALANLLGNAFKFTHRHTEVLLRAFDRAGRVLVTVEDRCGGLAADLEEKMFTPFIQGGDDRTGLGLGLSIARRSVESVGGSLTVRNLPGVGCVFTIDLPKATTADPPA